MTVNTLEIAFRTHVGLVRLRNEDYLAALPQQGVVLLADGMGGHRAGDVASRLAVETAVNELLPAQSDDSADDLESLLRVGQAVEAANQAIFRTVRLQPELSGMGTTIVAAVFREQRIFYAHVGDSRLYRIRRGRMRRLTRDHSLVQQMVDEGVFRNRAEARAAGVGDNVLTRTLGLDPQVEVDVGDAVLAPDDLYLFCSDGLSNKVPDREILGILRAAGSDLDARAEALLQAALDAGGSDNITLVLARPRPG